MLDNHDKRIILGIVTITAIILLGMWAIMHFNEDGIEARKAVYLACTDAGDVPAELLVKGYVKSGIYICLPEEAITMRSDQPLPPG